jgi:hypothetical protein
MKRLAGLAVAGAVATVAVAPASPNTAQTPPRAFLLKTAIEFAEGVQPEGRVLRGSFLGNAAFCRGGSFTDRFTRRAILKRLQCEDGTLTIRFAPRPEAPAQSSAWSIKGGTGAYKGLDGRGWMAVKTTPTGPTSARGKETFAGRLEQK